MCGHGVIYSLKHTPIENISGKLKRINEIQRHRGADANDIYVSAVNDAGLCNTRLKIVDFQEGIQPMKIGTDVIVFNGEIYNYNELKSKIEGKRTIVTKSDTEILLLLYQLYGIECLQWVKGIFSFVIYNEISSSLFCARDHFGIKPFYYTVQKNILYISSEAKSIVEYTDRQINLEGLNDYLVFQYMLKEKTLFKDIQQLPSGCYMSVSDGDIKISKYWEAKYEIDYDHTEKYFVEKLREILLNSVKIQSSTNLKLGAYCSGGIDSSIISILARKSYNNNIAGYHGRFLEGDQFDESRYAKELINYGIDLNIIDIVPDDFVNNIEDIIYYMDYPEAGIGVFPQYMVSKNIPDDIRVMLGGQGGDELFGGYIRYLLAYFEQCIKGSIYGSNQGKAKFIITYESILQNLCKLKGYEPMIKDFWANDLFAERDQRYFNLINRMKDVGNLINTDFIKDYDVFEEFRSIYNCENTQKVSYFNEMTFYDINTSLKALLHVEDRVSMANGIETRVPFLDSELFDFVATIPSDIKFLAGEPKRLLKHAYSGLIPENIISRNDKMGFPVPLQKWISTNKNVREFIFDIFNNEKAKKRFYLKDGAIDKILNFEGSEYSRNLWGLLCLEIWQSKFID